jgi:hypothetical protein
MAAITLRAHFDGERILLDEPFDLPAHTPLMVTVLSERPAADWSQFAAAALSRAYSDNEPDYSAADIKP